jgi:branched-chain amino acid transport system substrate-binding protein
MKRLTGFLLAVATSVFLVAGSASAAETIKLAYIDPLSGPFATTGTQGLAEWRYAVDTLVNKKGGVLGGRMMEVAPFDNKISPKESLIQLQVAIDQGIRIIIQGNSSGVANALTDAVEKHNQRNPDKEVIYLNYSAVDPALTNEKCNFWHFRFDANADIKMDALTDVMAADKSIDKVYIIGQDYSFGKAVAEAAVMNIHAKMPHAQIVGNELHPIGKVKDFTPYARKIVASHANAVITGNWGSDMVGLGKAIIEAGYKGPIYTYYAASNGITKTFGSDGVDVIRVVGEGQLNPPASERANDYMDGFKKKYPEFDIGQPRIANTVEMLAKAINQAGAVDARKIAYALEGMKHDSLWGGTLTMRKSDHQLIQDVHVMKHTNKGVTHDMDSSGFGLVVESTVRNAGMNSPTTCKMVRP